MCPMHLMTYNRCGGCIEMELRHLRAFASIVDAGGVGRAIARLHLSQPALSRQIRTSRQTWESGCSTVSGAASGSHVRRRGSASTGPPACWRTPTRSGERARALEERADGSDPDWRHTPGDRESARALPGALPEPSPRGRGPSRRGWGRPSARSPRARRCSSDSHAGGRRAIQRPRGCSPSTAWASYHRPTGSAAAPGWRSRSWRTSPVLVLRQGFGSREWFDAACQIAHVRPRVLLESGVPHTLVALARVGYGIALVPSPVPFDRRGVRAVTPRARGSADRQMGDRRLGTPGDSWRRTPSGLPREFGGRLATRLSRA